VVALSGVRLVTGVGDFLAAALVVEAADVADDPEQLGGVGEVDAHLWGHRDGAQDAFFGAAVASVVLGVLDEVGCRSGQRLLCGGQQARLIRLDRHDVVGVLDADEVFGGGALGRGDSSGSWCAGEPNARRGSRRTPAAPRGRR
jgi:hypothetical protein